MAFCTKCGASVADSTAFCPSCGTPQAGASAGAAVAVAPAQSQMSENVAGLLCYALGWITGLIFYFVDKRPFVRYHATQSIVAFGGLHLLSIVMGMFFGFSLLAGGLSAFSLGYAVYGLINLTAFILWVVLMIKAYQHDRFRVPIAADLAEKIFGKS
ncbi:MAG: zinc-ribbon domain-containing protein [Candidatus Acidiferrales bacterium]